MEEVVENNNHNNTGSTSESVTITLLLINSHRAEVIIDNEYLTNHDCQQLQHPQELSIQLFKNFLHQDWKEDWGNQPTNPANIRLIHLGKILEDGQTLQDYGLTLDTKHNVVHCSVKPESFELEQNTKKSSKRGGNDSRNNDADGDRHGSKCCIIC